MKEENIIEKIIEKLQPRKKIIGIVNGVLQYGEEYDNKEIGDKINEIIDILNGDK